VMESESALLARLVSLFATQKTLLVLDNFESVLTPTGGGTDWVKNLLMQSPTTHFLVTSRTQLPLRDAQRHSVSPLNRSDAIALFQERGHLTNPTLAEQEMLETVCKRLDALPLALELAAARLSHLALSEMVKRLENIFPLLTTRLHDVPERHRTLWNTLELSWQTLESTEQHLLELLALFPAGATLQAIEAIADDLLVLDTLGILEEASLVQCRPIKGVMRYTLLSLVREFAGQKARESVVFEQHRRAYARYFARFARERWGWNAWLYPTENDVAFRELQAEHENLRVAFSILEDLDDPALLDFVVGLMNYWWATGYFAEAGRAMETACTRLHHTSDPFLLCTIYRGRSSSLRREGKLKDSLDYLEKAQEHAQKAGDNYAMALNANFKGLSLAKLDDPLATELAYQEAMALFEAQGVTRGYLNTLSNLTLYLLSRPEDRPRALPLCEQGYALAREKAFIPEQLRFLSRLTSYYCESEEFHEHALSLGATFLAQSQSAMLVTFVIEAQINYGNLLCGAGQNELGVLLFFCAEELTRRRGHVWESVAREGIEQFGGHYTSEEMERVRAWARRQDEEQLFHPPRVMLMG
jgi:predicted ATPase